MGKFFICQNCGKIERQTKNNQVYCRVCYRNINHEDIPNRMRDYRTRNNPDGNRGRNPIIDKEKVLQMRNEGMSYGKIAEELDVSKRSVESFFYRESKL